MIRKTILLFILFSGNAFPQSGWYNINSGTQEDLYSIRMFSSSNIIAAGAHGYILHSTDGGNSWNDKYVEFDSKFNAIKITDSRTAYMVGYNRVVKTTDGGNNWEILPAFTSREITDVDFVNSETGYVCAAGYYNETEIFKTTNGGVNWFLLIPVSTKIHKIDFINASTGYGAGDYAGLYNGYVVIQQTTNGGVSWISKWLHYEGNCTDVYFLNSSTCFFAYNYSLLKTTNAGQDFTFIPTSGSELSFANNNVGYFCTAYVIQKTTDGGVSWYTQNTGSNSLIYSIDFINELTGYACGKNGKIMKTTSGGDTATVQIKSNIDQLPSDFSLHQNHPNPFNPETRITYEIRKTSDIKIYIYDLNGKHVYDVINKRHQPGRYTVNFDSRFYGGSTGINSGVYFYSLFADDHLIDTKKMIVIK